MACENYTYMVYWMRDTFEIRLYKKMDVYRHSTCICVLQTKGENVKHKSKQNNKKRLLLALICFGK